MATTKTTVDPLAGIPLATAKPIAATVAAPVPAGNPTNVINLKQAKRRRATGAEFKAARDQARKMTGYDSTSPIWGKKLVEVLVTIEEQVKNTIDQINAGDNLAALDAAGVALLLNQELQKRLATNAVIGSQLR